MFLDSFWRWLVGLLLLVPIPVTHMGYPNPCHSLVRIYIQWHTPKKGIRPILNTVSRMKVQATLFDTSQLGEVMNVMSHITTPLFSQPPRNMMSTDHYHQWLATRTHLQDWQTMTRPINVHGAHYWDWQMATRAHHHHINKFPLPGSINGYNQPQPQLTNSNKGPSPPLMNSHKCPPWQMAMEPLAPPSTNGHRCPWHLTNGNSTTDDSPACPHPPPLLSSLQATPHIPHISRHDGITIQMWMPAQMWRWTKHEPQPKCKYPHHVHVCEVSHNTSTSSSLSVWGARDSATRREHAAWTG